MPDTDLSSSIDVFRSMLVPLNPSYVSCIKSILQNKYDEEPSDVLPTLLDVWSGYWRDVERWASGRYREEQRHSEWVDVGGEQ